MIMHLWSVRILSTSRSFNYLWSGCVDGTQRVQLGDVRRGIRKMGGCGQQDRLLPAPCSLSRYACWREH